MYLVQDPIPISLVKMAPDLQAKAVKVFSEILKYMGLDGPPPAPQEEVAIVIRILKLTMRRVELRDELFAQLNKQTVNNPSR